MDLYKFCSDELKSGLDVGREMEQKLRDMELEEKDKDNKKNDEKKKDKDGDVEMKEEKVENKKTEKKIGGGEAEFQEHEIYQEHGTGLDTGHYQLFGIVTHKGRTLDGGHYVGWVHNKGGMERR